MAITKIAQVNVGAGGASSISFSSIPGIYTDLRLIVSSRISSVGTSIFQLIINGDNSTSAQSTVTLEGNGAGSIASISNSSIVYFANLGHVPGTDTGESTFNNAVIYIPNYSYWTNKAISVDTVTENNGATAYQGIYAGLRADTTAITSLTIQGQGNTLAQYSSATLYGISNTGATGATVS